MPLWSYLSNGVISRKSPCSSEDVVIAQIYTCSASKDTCTDLAVHTYQELMTVILNIIIARHNYYYYYSLSMFLSLFCPPQWSFGVTCWEVFTCGRVPYTGVPVMTLLTELHSGQRLERPGNCACSNEMYVLR